MSTIPDPSLDYRSSHSASGYGKEYVETFNSDRQLGQLWNRTELPLLTQMIDSATLPESARALDFACGTGRVTKVLAGKFRDVTGIDVSESMLEVAAEDEDVVGVEFIRHDLTAGENDRLGKFDIATAFRFFRNASPELRREAIAAIGSSLRPGAFLVANIHGNPRAPGIALLKFKNRNKVKIKTISETEFEELVSDAGFTVLRKIRYGVAPSIGNPSFGPYLRIAAIVEKMAHREPFSRFAESTMYLLQKTGD